VSGKRGRMVALNLANQLLFLLFLLTWTDRKYLLSFQFPARHKTNRSCPRLCNPLYLSARSVFTYTNMCTVRRFGEIKQQNTRESDHLCRKAFPTCRPPLSGRHGELQKNGALLGASVLCG